MMPRSRCDLGPRDRAVPSERSSRAASSAGAASRARATSTVRLPSTRSSPAGLPVVAGSPKTPSRSSRSWNASPSGSPNADSSASVPRRRAGERGADVQRPLDGVLRGLVAQHGHRGVDVGAAAGLDRDVEELAGDHLGAAQVEDLERRRDPARAAARSGAAARRTRSSSRSPSRIAAGGAVLLRVAAPAGARGARPRRPGAWRAGRAGCRRRPCSRRGPARWRAAARATAQARDQGGLVGDAGRDGAVAPPAERRAEPLAAGDRRPGLGDAAGRRRRPSGASRSACSSRKASSAAWTRLRKPALVPRRAHAPRLGPAELASGRSRRAPPVPRLGAHGHGTRTEHARAPRAG